MSVLGSFRQHFIGSWSEEFKVNYGPLVRERVGPLADFGWSREKVRERGG